ncbi:hypothetical protein niasHS_014382 [Heterodera schachtii]|uniref:Gamma-tubulin complex component n=1 Tax=Heterodera schachtii TaxID=97005 RepID=A0ABD2I792_HETSC
MEIIKISELYLALQGEQCYYTVPSIHKGFNVKNVPFECPSFSIALEQQLQQIVDFSGCVKAIETWKAEHMYNRMDCLDSVKKAILESIIDAYNIYQTEADRMRRENMLHKCSHSIADLCAFVRTWQQRLNHLLSLLHKSDGLCGLEMMNVLFGQWTFQCCINDWRYRMIETALLAGSTAMHQLLVGWLLDAKLAPAALTRWFIRPKCLPSSDDPNESQLHRPRHSFNNSVLSAAQLTMNGSANALNMSLNNMSIAANITTNYQNECCLFEAPPPTAADAAVMASATTMTRNSASFFGTTNAGSDVASIGTGTGTFVVAGAVVEDRNGWASLQQQLILSVQLDTDVLPAPFYGCEELLNMIMDIGRKVHFLKKLRPAHASNEQQQSLCAQLPTNVWCTPSAIGRMATILRQIHAVVSEEMGQELMGRQRLMDHLCLFHGYFFMLRGDFASALEHILFIKTAKTTATKKCATPFSSRKNVSHSTKIAEKCVNDALAMCAPPANVADLMHLLCGVKLTKREQMKCKIFSEKFMLKSRLREGQQNEFQAVAEFFSTNALRAYKRVFGFVSNLQLQRAQLDYTGQNLLRVVRQRLATRSEYRSSFYSMLIILQKVRMFLNRLAHYVFEEVLLLESIYIFDKVRATKDPHVLLAGLYPLLSGVLLALFLPSALSKLHESVQQCIRNASDFVGSISKFCVFIEHSDSDVLDALLLASTDDDGTATNDNISNHHHDGDDDGTVHRHDLSNGRPHHQQNCNANNDHCCDGIEQRENQPPPPPSEEEEQAQQPQQQAQKMVTYNNNTNSNDNSSANGLRSAAENRNNSRTTDADQQQQQQFHSVVFAISDSNVNFEASVAKLRNDLATLLAECSSSEAKSRYFTPYWSKLNALLFHD